MNRDGKVGLGSKGRILSAKAVYRGRDQFLNEFSVINNFWVFLNGTTIARRHLRCGEQTEFPAISEKIAEGILMTGKLNVAISKIHATKK